MSVIQDALRRKLVDQQRKQSSRQARPSGTAVPPPTPPIAQQVLRQEAMMRPEMQPKVLTGASVGAYSQPYPSPRGGVGRWILGTALVVLFAILVGGVLFSMNRGVRPLPHQPVDTEVFQPVPEDSRAWPEITVDGVLASPTTKKSSAILNGEMVFLNQKIQGVRLIDVSDEGVQLRYRGKTKALDIGSSTYDDED